MDLQKEREAFEKAFAQTAFYRNKADLYSLLADIDDESFDFFRKNGFGEYSIGEAQAAWKAWQAAKAHEAEKLKGCVLVPVQCPDPDFADSLFDELSKKAIGEFGDDLLIHFSDIDEEKIWALMVEAAKAQAAPEGFILVDKHQLAQLMANMDSFGKKALGDDYVSFADIAAVLDEAQEPTND